MNKFLAGAKRFLRDEEGTEVVEWALVAGLVVAVGAVIFTTIGAQAKELLTSLSEMLKSAGATTAAPASGT